MSLTSNRQLASPKTRRSAIKTDEDVERLFKPLRKEKPEPANAQTNPWMVKPFIGIIRGDFHQSSLPHDQQVEIKNGMQFADYLNISKREYINLIYTDFPNGVPKSSKTLADAKVAEYNKTLCHQFLLKHKDYVNIKTGEWSEQGARIDKMGKYLYNKFKQKDPALFTLEDFEQAKADPHFYTTQGKLKFSPLSALRCIMAYTALQVEDSPLSKKHFQFVDGDQWDTTGLKNIGGKKGEYLQEEELRRFVQAINEPDALVMHRVALEGGGRISSELLIGTRLPNGYRCEPNFEQNYLNMFEPKVEKSKTGGKVQRYFVPKTMLFFMRYTKDFSKKIEENGGQWFKRWASEEHNYSSYNSSIKAAGLRAGLWHFKTANKGQALGDGEHLAPDSRVYTLEEVANNEKGTIDYRKKWVIEGKLTTSHTVGKHTFVSLAGLHGISLDECSDQCGTDPTTIKDFYHGTLGDKRRASILGEKTFETWRDWIEKEGGIDELYNKRYDELLKQNKAAVDLNAVAQEEAAMTELAEDEE